MPPIPDVSPSRSKRRLGAKIGFTARFSVINHPVLNPPENIGERGGSGDASVLTFPEGAT